MKLAVGALVGLSFVQGRVLYEDPTRSIRIVNYVQGEGGTLENGDFEFKVTGRPATVEARLQGMTISGPTLEGKVAPAGADNRPGFARELLVIGGAVVTFDSEMQFKAMTEHAARFGTPVPRPPASKDVATLNTGQLAYVGNGATGTFTVPGAFTLSGVSTGTKNGITSNHFVTAKGTKATFALDPTAGGKALPIETGTITGPVQIDLKITETDPAKPTPTQNTITGVADNLDLDLKSTRTITLRGNVKIEGESAAYRGASEGDIVVVYLDESLKPIRIRITGDLTKSTLKDKSGGGKP